MAKITVEIPSDSGTVYTIYRIRAKCYECPHYRDKTFDNCINKCGRANLRMSANNDNGFLITFDENGIPVVSRAGEIDWSYREWVEPQGDDGKQYYTIEDAMSAIGLVKKETNDGD